MQDQESALTLIESDFLSSTNPLRIWKLVYFDMTFYLIDEERERFLKELAAGNTVIQIGGLTLTNKLVYMYQFKNKPSKKEYEEVIGKDGKISLREK